MATIIGSLDLSLLNRYGMILDETKNTFVLREDLTQRLVRVPKSIVKISVQSEGRNLPFHLLGSDLLLTPEERIKG
ncbi:MAG: ribonuclease P protein subunit [Nitrososphaerales archaeon]